MSGLRPVLSKIGFVLCCIHASVSMTVPEIEGYLRLGGINKDNVPSVLMCLAFTCRPVESYCGLFRSLLFCSCLSIDYCSKSQVDSI